MKVGDLVQLIESDTGYCVGVIVETDVNMWGEEVIPSGISVLWYHSEIETVYEDEIKESGG